MERNFKKYIFYGILTFLALVFCIRLFQLQIIEESNFYKAQAYGSHEIVLHPSRGNILDRNGELIVFNDAVYDLMFVPYQLKKENYNKVELCNFLNLDTLEFNKIVKKASRYNEREASAILKYIDFETYTKLQEELYKYPFFYIESRTDRQYNVNGMAHILGYLGEVNENQIKDDPYYRLGDFKGQTGIEKSYEELLRGVKGKRVVLKDKFSRHKGKFAKGIFDKEPIPGIDLVSSIDKVLQEFGESLLNNKIGSVVAIEPSTGEILALINNPTYNPNLLVGLNRNKNFSSLILDPKKPLFNRAVKAPYPPGSTFKLVQALIGYNEGVLNSETRYPCYGGYRMGSLKVGCHSHASPLDLVNSISNSCNAYYCYLYRSILDQSKYTDINASYIKWTEYLKSFGIGIKTDSDILEESKGIIKKPEYFQKIFGKNWKSANVVSMSIGQGEVGLTPIQMANFVSVIANKGYYIPPHLIKGRMDKKLIDKKYLTKRFTNISAAYFDTIIMGMAKVCAPGGTAGRTGIPGIEICAKTGTAQNPHGKDHSIYVAFAPRENPKIAICVIIENGGFGAQYAAPIANLMIEKYIFRDSVSKKQQMLNSMLNAKLADSKIYKVDSSKLIIVKPN